MSEIFGIVCAAVFKRLAATDEEIGAQEWYVSFHLEFGIFLLIINYKISAKPATFQLGVDTTYVFNKKPIPVFQLKKPRLPVVAPPPRRPMENENTLQLPSPTPTASQSKSPSESITPDYLTINAEDWENSIVWDETIASSLEEEYVERGKPPKFNYIVRNEHLESGNWLDAIVWDDVQAKTLNAESVDVIMEDVFDPTVATFTPISKVSEYTIASTTTTKSLTSTTTTRPSHLDIFNISNDKYYESNKLRTGRARHTFGPLVLQHSLPAIKLFRAYFKTGFTLKDMRSWHRPPINFPINMDIKLSKIKNKKKHQKKLLKSGGSSADLMKKSKDLTLKDNSKYVLFEYSEEYPPFIQNTGMASIIYNYYRKKDEKDAFVPNLDYGAPMVLELTDASPFFDMGDVMRGQTLPTLWNNLVRAPMFRHKVSETDFLLIK
jgi:transcription initiation factor TFIID subunit 1, fungi type